ncbi:DNA cytosine methyltransferase [Candidatus Gracilibacteria bacterium]|nr:DNA cytosine methyltransferase [Candidatus Gracilibacteria bacterium]
MKILDLFAGAGGLSEGFWKEGFDFVGHIEMDSYACETLETRSIYYYLKKTNNLEDYEAYVKGLVSKESLVKKYKLNEELKKIINAEIDDKNCDILISNMKKKLGNDDLLGIIGGPPCQAYSNIGRARDKNGMKDDKRNHLYKFYLKFLKELKPKFFIFENVPGLLTAGGGVYLKNMISDMRALGYTVPFPDPVNMADFGIPQKRKRIIMIGWKKGVDIDIKEVFKKNSPHSLLVNDFLVDLPQLKDGQGDDISEYIKPSKPLVDLEIRDISVVIDHIARPHNEQDKEIYRIAVEKYEKEERLKYTDLPKRLKTHSNEKSFLDRFKVIEGNMSACHTVVAHISKDGHHYIHPDGKQNRSLSIREAARLQTFPDSYKFEGPRTSQFKQIGNAVPPMFSQLLAKRLKKHFK